MVARFLQGETQNSSKKTFCFIHIHLVFLFLRLVVCCDVLFSFCPYNVLSKFSKSGLSVRLVLLLAVLCLLG